MPRKLTALVIGNAAYPGAAKLKNPVHDAQDVSAAIAACDFSVTTVVDSGLKDMEKALRAFKGDLNGSDVGLFFFAGHGMQIDGENYLNTIDTDFEDEVEAKHSSLALNKVIELMERSEIATNIIILDACRNNPFERAWHRSASVRGLAPVYAPRGTLIAYATSPGQYASDGSGRNGAYTKALLQHLRTPDCSIENMFKRVRNTLSAATLQKQISWEHTSLAGEYFFNLSLGKRIDEYPPNALSDKLFVLDDSKASHQLIAKLKSLTWPTQNPAIDGLTAAKANKFPLDPLFVIGRNIYQSANGNSRSAVAYIKDFMTKTQGMEPTKRKALLDGILFEIFFDSAGALRREFKDRFFGEVFALQQFDELSESFDFIAECLLPEAARFYALPGKKHEVVLDVTTKRESEDEYIVEAIYCGGASILAVEPDSFAADPAEPMKFEKMSISAFETKLTEQMMVPAHLLKIHYSSLRRSGYPRVLFPRGYSARKPLPGA
jgi:hypothetical protein